MEKQIVIFSLAGELYGVDIARVESIIKMQAITRMPQAPFYVKGITNIRGTILPVIDLKTRLGLPESEVTKDNRIVVAALSGSHTGMIVDGVSAVDTISDELIEPAPSMTLSIDTDYIQGIAKVKNGADGEVKLIILLDLAKIIMQTNGISIPA